MGFRGSFRCSVVLALAGAALAFRLPTPPLGAPSSARLCTQPGRGRSHRFGINHVVASAARSSRSGAAGKVRRILFQMCPPDSVSPPGLRPHSVLASRILPREYSSLSW